MPARTPPTTTLPRSAQKTKNLVLSQIHGCSTMTLGTRNHSHIGANQRGNAVGNQRTRKWPAIISAASRDVFQIQNHAKSNGNSQKFCCQSVGDSQPSWRQ